MTTSLGHLRSHWMLQIKMLQWRIHKSEHLSKRFTVLRGLALASMRDGPSAQLALSNFNIQTNFWLDKHHAIFEPIATSVALLSLAHLLQRAETFGVTLNSSIIETAHKLLDLTLARQHLATNHVIAMVFWSLARLKIPPASVVPEYEASLAQAYIATQHESTLVGMSNMLWALSVLQINPLSGKLLGHIVQEVEDRVADPALVPSKHMQVQIPIARLLETCHLIVAPAARLTCVFASCFPSATARLDISSSM